MIMGLIFIYGVWIMCKIKLRDLFTCLLLILVFLPAILFAEEKGVNEWIDAAIKNSASLKIALKRVELSEGRVWQARRELFPELVFSYKDKDGKVSGQEYDGVSYKGKLSKIVFDGGRSFYTLSRQEMELEKAGKEYEKLKREIALQGAKAYWELVRASLSKESFEGIFKDIEELTQEAEKVYAEGLITQREYLEIKSQFLKTLVKKNTLEKDEKIAMLDFRHVVNLKNEEPVDARKKIPFEKVEMELSKLWELAQKNRLERDVTHLDKEMKRLNLLIAEREKWPEVGVSFSYGSSGEDYKFNCLELDDEWQVTAEVTMDIGASSLSYNYDKADFTPVVGSFRGEEIETHSIDFSILDRLDKNNKVREEEIRFDEAGEKKETEEKEIRREVEEAYYNLKKARINVEAASKDVSFRLKDVEIVSLQKGLGKTDLAELVRAKIFFEEAKSFYFSALAEHVIGIAELEYAVGGL